MAQKTRPVKFRFEMQNGTAKEFVIHSATAVRYPGSITLSGSIHQPFSSEPQLALEVGVKRLDIAQLLNQAGVARPAVLATRR